MSLFDLSGRVAIVTGGNGGIGLGMAKGLAAAGAAVIVAARNREKSDGAVAELTALGARSAFVPLDVADPQSCRAMVQKCATSLAKPAVAAIPPRNGCSPFSMSLATGSIVTTLRRAPSSTSCSRWAPSIRWERRASAT